MASFVRNSMWPRMEVSVMTEAALVGLGGAWRDVAWRSVASCVPNRRKTVVVAIDSLIRTVYGDCLHTLQCFFGLTTPYDSHRRAHAVHRQRSFGAHVLDSGLGPVRTTGNAARPG